MAWQAAGSYFGAGQPATDWLVGGRLPKCASDLIVDLIDSQVDAAWLLFVLLKTEKASCIGCSCQSCQLFWQYA